MIRSRPTASPKVSSGKGRAAGVADRRRADRRRQDRTRRRALVFGAPQSPPTSSGSRSMAADTVGRDFLDLSPGDTLARARGRGHRGAAGSPRSTSSSPPSASRCIVGALVFSGSGQVSGLLFILGIDVGISLGMARGACGSAGGRRHRPHCRVVGAGRPRRWQSGRHRRGPRTAASGACVADRIRARLGFAATIAAILFGGLIGVRSAGRHRLTAWQHRRRGLWYAAYGSNLAADRFQCYLARWLPARRHPDLRRARATGTLRGEPGRCGSTGRSTSPGVADLGRRHRVLRPGGLGESIGVAYRLTPRAVLRRRRPGDAPRARHRSRPRRALGRGTPHARARAATSRCTWSAASTTSRS